MQNMALELKLMLFQTSSKFSFLASCTNINTTTVSPISTGRITFHNENPWDWAGEVAEGWLSGEVVVVLFVVSSPIFNKN